MSPARYRPLVSLLAALFLIASPGSMAQIPEDSRQLVLTLSSEWDAPTGQAFRFERQGDRWQQVGVETPVNLGRAGLAWGIGLHPEQPGQQKVEGDGRAPAGIFRLGDAFGYGPSLETGLDYQPMTEGHYCIDVKGSPYYNQTVDAGEVGAEAVRGSSEGMRRDLHYGDDQYKKGIFVAHNPANIDGAGSCIFVHLWSGPGEPTAGCTAFAEPELDRMLAWLKEDANPVYVALPEEEYRKLREEWQLPQVRWSR
ncbi:L,D-transpeptidase family protein [Microbulbifer guangxiensis]|uniref:L,D-transpeptidase family protein n=1 Tax=Microbulbifer guangxiensis TaxID=2904249 RepID=UPI001F254E94|nr:hypothetical protein [Microbulbifer guangxiensis]